MNRIFNRITILKLASILTDILLVSLIFAYIDYKLGNIYTLIVFFIIAIIPSGILFCDVVMLIALIATRNSTKLKTPNALLCAFATIFLGNLLLLTVIILFVKAPTITLLVLLFMFIFLVGAILHGMEAIVSNFNCCGWQVNPRDFDDNGNQVNTRASDGDGNQVNTRASDGDGNQVDTRASDNNGNQVNTRESSQEEV